jgi:hypothetical protein
MRTGSEDIARNPNRAALYPAMTAVTDENDTRRGTPGKVVPEDVANQNGIHELYPYDREQSADDDCDHSSSHA